MHVSMGESNSIKEVDPSPPYMNGNSHCLRVLGPFRQHRSNGVTDKRHIM